ncbi:hypothetical protein OEZ86_004967 [Tetradesmus obliquus]|nr:hypothetical protein OEZ86_004967 [Tetradesmus obliquus]
MSDRQQALKVLGLAEGATDEDIRLAYKSLSIKWHPDKNQGSSEATHMMQQLNAAKDKLGQDDGYSDDEYESDGYYSDEYEDDYDDDPFNGPTMNFAAFLRMYARMRDAGQIDEYGEFMPPGASSGGKPRGTRGGEFCYCPECMRVRRSSKEADRQARREQARRYRLEQEAEAAEARAQEEADRRLQRTDPKASIAWKKGGEHRERVIREHFLRQTPRLLLHAATDSSLTLVLDAPDLSLLDGKLPPKGVEWEVSFSAAGDKKWTSLLATREYDNIQLPKLQPGTEYSVKVRTGLAGNHTWSGTPDWGTWNTPQKFKTAGRAAGSSSGGGSSSAAGKASKKKKNRDAGFAAMFAKKEEDGEEGQGEAEEEEEEEVEEQEDANSDDAAAGEGSSAAEDTHADDANGDEAEYDAADYAEDEEQQQQEVQQAPAAAAAAAPRKSPKIPPLCVFWQQGKCRFGASCKFRHMSLPGVDDAAAPTTTAADDDDDNDESLNGEAHSSPAAAAVAAAARARKDVDALDHLMSGGVQNMSLARAAEAARLAGRAASYVPRARYQPAPVSADGSYLPPLFLTAYNVVDSSYAAWYRDMVQGGAPAGRVPASMSRRAQYPQYAAAPVSQPYRPF